MKMRIRKSYHLQIFKETMMKSIKEKKELQLVMSQNAKRKRIEGKKLARKNALVLAMYNNRIKYRKVSKESSH